MPPSFKTEEEAGKTWCPLVRMNGANRGFNPETGKTILPKGGQCVGSLCSQWETEPQNTPDPNALTPTHHDVWHDVWGVIPHDINENVKINAAFNHGENLISAIKEVRAHYGVGLKEAKDMVEGLRVKRPNGTCYLSLPTTHEALAHLYIQEKNAGRCENRIPPYVELPQKPRGRCGAVFKREDPDMFPDQTIAQQPFVPSAAFPLTPPPGSLSARVMQALAEKSSAVDPMILNHTAIGTGTAAEAIHKTALRRIAERATSEHEAKDLMVQYLQTQNLIPRDTGLAQRGQKPNEVYIDEHEDIESIEDAFCEREERELDKIFVEDQADNS